MRIILFFLLVIFTADSCDPDPINTSCLPQMLENNIVAFYPFSSGDLADNSRNKNTLINTKSSLTEDRNGNQNCAYAFKKSDGSFLKSKGNITDGFHLKSFSISLWYKPTETRSPGDLERLISRTKNDKSNLLPNWSIELGDCRAAQFSVIGKYLRDHKDSMKTCDELIIDLSEEWHHLVCTFDGSRMELFRNGIKSDRIQDNSPFGPALLDNGDIFIGLDYTGAIDDVIIFDKKLSVSEILSLYNTEACCL